jgi:branched-chain amino acid transport system substrate-binding protein
MSAQTTSPPPSARVPMVARVLRRTGAGCRAWLALGATLALAACAGTGTTPQSQGFGQAPTSTIPGAAASVPAPPGTAVALLVPLSGANAERGQILQKAAELALAGGGPHLDIHDTESTPTGAASAAQAAIAAGDSLILGPLTAGDTAAVAPIARAAGVPVLAFTNDPSQAQPGVWTLGITPTQQVRRLAGLLVSQGKQRFAALLPPGDFGSIMGTALTQALASAGAPSPDIHVRDDSNNGIAATIRDLSDYGGRRAPLDARIKAARAMHNAEGRKEAAQLSRQEIPPPPFDVLLLADTGEKLGWEVSFLQYYDIGPPQVRLIGPALWANPAMRGGASLTGAWYAAPDPAARTQFDQAYAAKYGSPAPGLADVAFDAASIARVVAQDGRYSIDSLSRPDGFAGVNGVLGLEQDGTVRRGLAVFEIHPDGPSIVDPAPTSLAGPGT